MSPPSRRGHVARVAARDAGGRRVLRLGRRRQDVGRGGGRARRGGAGSAARCSCSRSTRRAGWPTRSGSRPSATSSAGCRSTRYARARRRAARRAVGRDARHQAVVGRAGAAARARRGDRVPHPRQPAVPQRHRPLRAEPRLHRDGAAVRAARRAASTTSSSSTRRRRGTRSTSSRRPRAWPTSSAAGCCAGSPCRTASAAGAARACSTSPASPSTRWPTASSAASSSRTSPSSSSTSSRCTTGFVERADAVEQLLHDRRTTFVVVTTLEGAPLREAEHFCDELTARDFHLGALVLNKVLPEYLLVARRRARGRRARARRATRSRRELAATGVAALADTTCDRARAARRVAESFRNYEVVAPTRGRAARRAQARAAGPEVVVSVPAFAPTSPTSPVSARIGEPSSVRPADRRYDPPRDHVLRAGAHQDRALGRIAASRPAARGVVAAARRPLLLRPPAARAGRGRGRAAASWCSRQVRPTTGQTLYPMDLVGAVVDEVGAAARRRVRSRTGEIVEGDAPLLGVERAGARAVHPGAPRGLGRSRWSRARPRPTLGRDLGELEQHYLETFDRFAHDDRRGHASRSARTTTSSRTRRASATA